MPGQTRLERHAYTLGSRDAYAGRPMLADTDDSAVMTELGETSATTGRNAGARGRMLDAYRDGYHAALTAMGGPVRGPAPAYPGEHGYGPGVRADTIDCDDCGTPTDHGMAWGNALLCPACYGRRPTL